jgi:hypothetical protein
MKQRFLTGSGADIDQPLDASNDAKFLSPAFSMSNERRPLIMSILVETYPERSIAQQL